MSRVIDVLVITPGDATAVRQTIDLDLSALQGLVGGYLEAISFDRTLGAVYINEEGKLRGLPYNAVGDLFVTTALDRVGRTLIGGDMIVGPIVVVGPPDSEGDETSVTEAAVDLCRELDIPLG